MNNDFYYSNNQNNEVKYSGSQKNLLLVFTAIVLIAVGYISMTSGIFDKVNGIETTTERKIVYVGEEETIKVKVKNNGEFNPAVKFKSEKDNFTLSEDIQYGEEVETKIIGSKVGSDTLVIEAGKDASKKEKSKEVEVIVCDKPEITNTGDKIINVKEGNNLKLEFNLTNECLKGYEIEIENDSVASIDSNYNLSAKKVGTTDLVLKRKNDRIKYKVNVKTADIGVKRIIINAKSLNIELGKTKKLSISVLPSDATNRKVTYKSSDENIATVSSNGTVKGISVGTATITVTSASDSSKSGSVKVKVYKQEVSPQIVNVTSVAFKSSSYTIEQDSTQSLEVVVSPSNATNKTISCSSSDKSVATVTAKNNTCVVKGIKKGTVTITATSKDGSKKGTTSVTINEKPSTTISVTGVSFESSSYKVYVGSTTNLVATVTPSNATNKTITCKSSNTSVATVSVSNNTCVAKGVKAGTATITVTTKDGSKTATASLIVENEPIVTVSVTSIKFDSNSYKIAYNETKKLVLGVTPTNASNKAITCKSLNTTIVTVSYSGNTCTIKGIKPGTTTIEAYSVDGNKQATASVTVNSISVTSIAFEQASYAVNVGATVTAVVKFTPSNASNQILTCSTSDSSIATVSAKGASCVVKGVKAGSVTITATSQDGNKTAKATVTINSPSTVTGYTIKYDLNGGSGTTPPNQKVKYNDNMPKVTTDKPTKAGYKFMGWYDNVKYLNGKKYNNEDGTSANKYDKADDITLYAGWKPYQLYIQYGGNGGEWHATKDTYSVNSSGIVVINDGTNTIYKQTINYGSSLPDAGLVDCNGGYMNWTKKNYGVMRNKEYIINDTNKVLDQAKAYDAKTLASYGNCDLTTKNCTIQVKVNWTKAIIIEGKNYATRYKGIAGFKGYPQNFAIGNFGTSNETLYIASSGKGNIQTSNTSENDIELLNTAIISKLTLNGSKMVFKEAMYLKDSGHGQPFDYDTSRDVIITNDYKDYAIYGTTKYGSSTGLMGIKFSKVDRGGTYSKLFSYNLNVKEPMPILDNSHKIFGTIRGTTVKLYDYNYDTLKNGKMNFSKPKWQFTLKRSDPTKYSDGSTISSQGFTVYNGFIYELSGGYGKAAYVEAFDFYGNSVYKIKLANGYSTANSREGEGIKVYNNNIYILSTYAVNGNRKVDLGYYN